MAKRNENKRESARILIVDDHPVFREGLVGVLAGQRNLSVVGQANHARQAMNAMEKLRPDLVLLDLSLPDKSGLEFVKDLRAIYPDMGVLVISMHDETLYAERLLRAGANGYVMKEEGPEKILQAIRQVLAHQTYVSSRMSSRILNSLSNGQKSSSPFSRLTDREFEIFRLIGDGHDSRDIARKLGVSPKTVDTHRSHIKQKLRLGSGMELICYAVRWVQTQSAISEPK